MRKLRKGFTIVELVIVIAVIAVLAAVLIPTFIHLSKKAKEASDTSLVTNLNTALKMEESDTGKKPKTMHDAVLGLENQGYKVPQLVTKSDQDLVYNIDENKFFLSSSAEQLIAEKEDLHTYDFWHIESSLPTTQKWSVYAFGWPESNDVVDLTVGFDSGKESIASIEFDRASATEKRNVLIHTNSEITTLTVKGYVSSSDNKVGDVVSHYGVSGALNIIKCATGSYHEFGKVGFAEISTGRIVLEGDSNVEHIHINKKSDAESFDEIIIEDAGSANLPSAITRDEVSVPSESSVDVVKVVSSGSEEVVKAYGSSATGSTQKTTTQNTEVSSSLGQLVLDNGATSDKALNPTEKQDVKDEVASESVSAEFEKDPANADYVARIGLTGYLKVKTAIDAATDGKTVVLLKDVEFEGITGNARLFITHNIIFDGNGHSVRAHGRGFGIGTSKVTFKNVSIVNPDAGARCIDTRGGTGTPAYPAVEELNLFNVNLSTPGSGGYLQPLTIGGNQSFKMKITIEDSILRTSDNGNSGYTIISFNPVDMVIRNSEISGWAAIYLKGPDSSYGATGSTVEVYNSKLYSYNKYRGSSDNFGTIVFEDANISLLLSNCELHANAEYVSQTLIVFSAFNGAICTNSSVEIVGDTTVTYGELLSYGSDGVNAGGEGCSLVIKGGTFSADPSDYVDTTLYNVSGNGPYKVTAK